MTEGVEPVRGIVAANLFAASAAVCGTHVTGLALVRR